MLMPLLLVARHCLAAVMTITPRSSAASALAWAPVAPHPWRASHASRIPWPGFIFAGMAVVSFLLIMPASVISDRLGRKWTIVPSCIAIASACILMAASGDHR